MNFRSPLWSGTLSAVLFLVLVVAAGCGTKRLYGGPKLSAEQVSILKIGRLTIYMIDDQPFDFGETRVFEILPGEHVIRATIDFEGYNERPIDYIFIAEAGHRYLFDVDYEIARAISWKPWIKDIETGEIVGRWE